MNTAFHSFVKKHKSKFLIEVKRHIKDVTRTTGFVVDSSDSLFLFHSLDMDTFRLNGYSVLREEDISQYRVFTKPEFWQFRAVKHFHLKPIRPEGISLDSFSELLKSVSARFPLITFHREKKNPDVCYIGPITSITKQTCTIEDLDCNAEWSGPRRMKFSDITGINFGDGYAEALAMTAPKRMRIIGRGTNMGA